MKHERIIVFGLMLLAALRVVIYSALLPALSRPDEAQHFDRILTTSKGDFAFGLRAMSQQANAAFIWGLRSKSHRNPNSPVSPPRPIKPQPKVSANDSDTVDWNHESCEPPLYYGIAGAWHFLGAGISWKPSLLPYWDRFLNGVLLASVVWIGYAVSRIVIPAHPLIAPAFLAFLPQSDLYGINNDALMPGVFGLFTLSYAALCSGKRAILSGLSCGLLLAACGWTKTTSAPIVAVGCAAVALTCIAKSLPRSAAASLLGLVSLAPLAVLNYRAFGRITGAMEKMRREAQTVKPLSAWIKHPVFTLGGLMAFWAELTNFYWLGEMPLNEWHEQALFGVPYALAWLCPILTIVVLVSADRTTPVLRMSSASFIASVAFLAICSAATDFGFRTGPSHWWSFPGFVGGRLMIGTLVPFSLLVASALSRLRSGVARAFAIVAVLATLNAMSAWMLADCFTGRYVNLFGEL
jgi:hypothetical protein